MALIVFNKKEGAIPSTIIPTNSGAMVTSSMVTCSKGDDAAEGHVIALWAVWSVNGFTARAAELPYDFLKHVSQRMTNEIREVGAVVYRVSDKPPVTIEWG